MRGYDFFSKTGVHPLLHSAVTSSIGKPYHEVFQKDNSSLSDTVGSLIEIMNNFAAQFLKYVDEVYPLDWNKNPELKLKKNFILGIEDGEAGPV